MLSIVPCIPRFAWCYCVPYVQYDCSDNWEVSYMYVYNSVIGYNFLHSRATLHCFRNSLLHCLNSDSIFCRHWFWPSALIKIPHWQKFRLDWLQVSSRLKQKDPKSLRCSLKAQSTGKLFNLVDLSRAFAECRVISPGVWEIHVLSVMPRDSLPNTYTNLWATLLSMS